MRARAHVERVERRG